MAARENQGLQIALIVFVTLTVLLSLTTFVFFRNYQNEQKRADGAAKDASQAASDKAKAEDERKQLLQFIGFSETEKMEAVADARTKDMATYESLLPAKLAEDQKTYKKLVDGLAGVVRTRNAENQMLAQQHREAKTLYDKKIADYERDLKKMTEDKDAAVAEYLQVRTKVNNDLADLTVSKTELQKEKEAKEKELTESKQQAAADKAGLQKTLDSVKQQLANRSEDLNKISGKFSVSTQPNGKIIWVNQRDGLAYINLGTDDRLRKRITFAVFDPNTTDVSAIKGKTETAAELDTSGVSVSEAKKKGVIEVVEITNAHMAECRILQTSNSNPLLPGDLIFTPLWHPGQQDHFALVGFIDIDGDGASDRQKVHDVIRVHGGIIDAETDDKGNLQGAVTHLTRYLIEGNVEDREGGKGTSASSKKLLDDAKTLGVEVIDLARFLDMMGFVPGNEAKSVASQQVRVTEAGEPVNNFRYRLPPPQRGHTGSAY